MELRNNSLENDSLCYRKKITHYVGVLHPGVALDFETVRYIFISFFVLLDKHFGSIITCLGFDFHWKKSTCTIFLQQKERYEVCKSL